MGKNPTGQPGCVRPGRKLERMPRIQRATEFGKQPPAFVCFEASEFRPARTRHRHGETLRQKKKEREASETRGVSFATWRVALTMIKYWTPGCSMSILHLRLMGHGQPNRLEVGKAGICSRGWTIISRG